MKTEKQVKKLRDDMASAAAFIKANGGKSADISDLIIITVSILDWVLTDAKGIESDLILHNLAHCKWESSLLVR
jgi:hypothetical protein